MGVKTRVEPNFHKPPNRQRNAALTHCGQLERENGLGRTVQLEQ